ncbi:MAG: hypothetical protein HY909_30295, partial [Deltaproteobacteria bacterium]|nr:hypothetical protein [Deltaproteobacteria bacterium]
MADRFRRWVLWSAVVGQLSCGLFRSGNTAPTAGAGQGPVRVFTDSDLVTDITASGTQVFVGTYRGILRYNAEGGAPTRLGRAEGLPADEVYTVAVSDDGATVWAATPGGVVRSQNGGRFAPVGDGQPDVGRPTALVALDNGALLGGQQGLARFDGTRWYKLTDHYQVTAMTRDGQRVLVATAQAGLLVLGADFQALDEHGLTAGLPDALVRDVVAMPGGRLWALCQGTGGMSLAHYDGSRWYAYTSEQVRSTWLALVPSGSTVALVVPGAWYDIELDHGEDLTPLNAAPAGGVLHVPLSPVAFEPPPPPPAPP